MKKFDNNPSYESPCSNPPPTESWSYPIKIPPVGIFNVQLP